MKTNKTIYLFILFILIFVVNILVGCKGEQGPVGPSGSTLKGDIVGFIKMIDYNGNQLTDASGTNVSIENMQASSLTQTNGKFTLTNISSGTYNLLISRSNYPNHKIISFQHLGGNPTYLGITNYYQIPAFIIGVFNVTANLSNVNISGTIEGQLPTSTRYIRIFVNTSGTVTNDPANHIFSVLTSASSVSTSFNTSISSSTLRNYGIIQGIPIYLAAFPEAYSGGNYYLDINTGKYYYVSVNPVSSNVIAVIAP